MYSYSFSFLNFEIFFPWHDFAVTVIPPPKQKRGKGEIKLRVHESGCARSEGYYKIPMTEKSKYLKSALKQLNVIQRRDENETDNAKKQVRDNYLKCCIF